MTRRLKQPLVSLLYCNVIYIKDNRFESESESFSCCFFHWETIKVFVTWLCKFSSRLCYPFCPFEYILHFTSKPLWPWETKKLNLVEIDSCPIILCVVSMWPTHQEGVGGLLSQIMWADGNSDWLGELQSIYTGYFPISEFRFRIQTPQITQTQRERVAKREKRRWRRQSPWRWW